MNHLQGTRTWRAQRLRDDCGTADEAEHFAKDADEDAKACAARCRDQPLELALLDVELPLPLRLLPAPRSALNIKLELW